MSPHLALARLLGVASLTAAAFALGGCAAVQRQQLSYDLDATQAALDAQMVETARLENPPAPPPTSLAEQAAAPRPDPAPVAETPPPPPAEPDPVVTALTEETPTYWEGDRLVGADVAPIPGPAPGPGASSSLVGPAERIAQALELQLMSSMMEARLADKQRLMDAMSQDILALQGGTPTTSTPSTTAAARAAAEADLRRQLAQLSVSHRALEQKLAQQEAEKAQATRDTAATAEVDRWTQLAARLEALETSTPPPPASAGATAAPGATAASSPRSTSTPSEVETLRAELARRDAEQTEQERRHQDELQYQQLAMQQRALEESLQKQDTLLERLFRRPEPTPAIITAPTAGLTQADLQAAIQTALAEQETRSDGRVTVAEIAADPEKEARLQAERAALATELENLSSRLSQLETDQSQKPVPNPAQQAEIEGLSQQISQLQGRETEIASLQTELVELQQRDVVAREALARKLKPLEEAGLTVEIIDGQRARVRLPSDILFDSGSAALSVNGQRTARSLAAVVNTLAGVTLQVEGHTDSVPIRSSRYRSNWDLAFARSSEVLGVLVQAGVPASRVSAASFGDSRPLTSNDTREGRSANRRIEVSIQLKESQEQL